MRSVGNSLRAAARQLRGDDASREAELLLAHAIGRSRAWLIAHRDDAIADAHRSAYEALVERRAAGEPIAYLVGTRGFHALELEVGPDVLIPRVETELLVELALRRIPLDGPSAVADLGTGSGAVALAIAVARVRARVLATDASEAALAVARHNAAQVGADNVAFAHGDWCAALGSDRFDMIVANPPYIADADPHLQTGDLRFEPRLALASGPDGLDAIRMIVRDAPAHLEPAGWLLFEHGCDQGPAARALLERSGYGGVFTARDLEGRERVSGGRRIQGLQGRDGATRRGT